MPFFYLTSFTISHNQLNIVILSQDLIFFLSSPKMKTASITQALATVGFLVGTTYATPQNKEPVTTPLLARRFALLTEVAPPVQSSATPIIAQDVSHSVPSSDRLTPTATTATSASEPTCTNEPPFFCPVDWPDCVPDFEDCGADPWLCAEYMCQYEWPDHPACATACPKGCPKCDDLYGGTDCLIDPCPDYPRPTWVPKGPPRYDNRPIYPTNVPTAPANLTRKANVGRQSGKGAGF